MTIFKQADRTSLQARSEQAKMSEPKYSKPSQAKLKNRFSSSEPKKNLSEPSMGLSIFERKIKWTGRFLEFASHFAGSLNFLK